MATTKIVSFSELDTLRQCQFKHQLAYRERWQPLRVAPALSRGKLFHEVMELYYSQLEAGMKPAGAVQAVQTSGLLFDEHGNSTDEQDLVAWVFQGYVERWTAGEWKILGVELAVNAMLPTRKGTTSSFRLKGKVDLLVQDHSMGSGLWVVDHKTCKNLPKGKELDLDDQMGIYIYLLQRQGYDIRGAIYNACRTEKLKRPMTMDERFKRVPLVRQEKELETMVLEAYDHFRVAYAPRNQDPPRSPDSDRCNWRCPFTEACLAGRKGGDTREMLEDTGFEQNWERH